MKNKTVKKYSGKKGQTEDMWRSLLGIVILISVLLLFAVFLAKISGDTPLLTTSSSGGGACPGSECETDGSGVSITGSGGDIVVE